MLVLGVVFGAVLLTAYLGLVFYAEKKLRVVLELRRRVIRAELHMRTTLESIAGVNNANVQTIAAMRAAVETLQSESAIAKMRGQR